MEYASAFRIYGNYLRDRKIPTASLAHSYLEMLGSWEEAQVRDMFYEYSVAELETECVGWRQAGDEHVCRILERLIAEKLASGLA